MPLRKQSFGRCTFCERRVAKGWMSRHLASCTARQEAIEQAGETSDPFYKFFYHLRIEDVRQKDFWLHLEINAFATLSDLDYYLRGIWLDCCGHLSRFSVGGWSAQEIPKKTEITIIFARGMPLTHIYDFGTPSETLLKEINTRHYGTALSDEPIYLMARNEPPEAFCMVCGQAAVWLCLECLHDLDKPGTLCDQHAQVHPHENYGELRPLVNSPRVGMCGYTGPAEPPY